MQREIIISDADRPLSFVMACSQDKLCLIQGRNRITQGAREADRLIDAIHELRESHAVSPSKARLLRYVADPKHSAK